MPTGSGRDWQTFGETIVKVLFGDHALLYAGVKTGLIFDKTTVNQPFELGLASEKITITPNFKHKEVMVNDFGSEIPVNVMWNLTDVTIKMTLIHYDPNILDFCMRESMGGIVTRGNAAGIMQPAGKPLGGGYMMDDGIYLPYQLTSGNHFITMGLFSATSGDPWRFWNTYLTSPPVVIPLGTRNSMVDLNWRCIPFVPLSLTPVGHVISTGPSTGTITVSGTQWVIGAKEVMSSGMVLWDRGDVLPGDSSFFGTGHVLHG